MNIRTIGTLVLLVGAAVRPGIAVGQTAAAAPPPWAVEYSVKVLCGRSVQPQQPPQFTATGQYFTVVNVHNPDTATTTFRFKVAYAGIPNESQGPVSAWFPLTVGPDRVLRIDCTRIQAAPQGAVLNPVDGFVVIQSRVPLDVVAVYTAAAPNAGNGALTVVSIHTEPVSGRRIP